MSCSGMKVPDDEHTPRMGWSPTSQTEEIDSEVLRCRKRAREAITAAPLAEALPASPERPSGRELKQARSDGPSAAQLAGLKKLMATLAEAVDADVKQVGSTLAELLTQLGGLSSQQLQLFQQYCVSSGLVLLAGSLLGASYPVNIRLRAVGVLQHLTSACPAAKSQLTANNPQLLSDLGRLLTACEPHAVGLVVEVLQRLVDKSPDSKRAFVAMKGIAFLLSCAASLARQLHDHERERERERAAEVERSLTAAVNALWLCITETKAADVAELLHDDNVDMLVAFLARPSVRAAAAAIVGHLASLSPAIAAAFDRPRGANAGVFAAIDALLSPAAAAAAAAAAPSANDCQWAVYAVGTLLQDSSANVDRLLDTDNVVPALCRFVKSQGHDSLQRLAAVALHHIIENTRAPDHKILLARQLAAGDIFESLAAVLLTSPVVVSQATLLVVGALPHLFGCAEFQAAALASPVFDALLGLLSSTSNMIQVFLATQAVSNIMLFSQATCRALTKDYPRVIKLMITLLDCACSNVQCIACSVLCSSAAVHYEVSNDIRKAGGIEKLVKMLGTPVARLLSRVVGCLGSVASNSGHNKKLIRELGAIPTLVNLLKSPSPETHTIAAAALSNLVVDSPPNQELLLRYGGVAVLVDNLASPSVELRTWSLRALYNSSRSNTLIGTEIGRLGGCSVLCQQLLKLTTGKDFSMHQTLCG